MDFKDWLLQKGYADQTSKNFDRAILVFTNWLATQNKHPLTASYQDILNYIHHLQGEERSRVYINAKLRMIKHYYDYLNALHKDEIPNIALDVQLRGSKKYQPLLLTEEELEQLYTKYQNSSDSYNRSYYKYSNHLILGLIIYQGLDRHDLYRLQIEDLDLAKGRLYVPSGSRSKNSRYVALEGHQIYNWLQYLEKYRGIGKNGMKSTETSTKLLHPNTNNIYRISAQLDLLNTTIKSQFTEISYRNLTQLKQSRIRIWISKYGLRKAQYLSGYKSISGVERYIDGDLQQLSDQVSKYHPM